MDDGSMSTTEELPEPADLVESEEAELLEPE